MGRTAALATFPIRMEPSPLVNSHDAELLAHHTWPCRQESPIGDWILRAAAGYSRRANSVLAVGTHDGCLDETLAKIVSWYREQEVEPCMKITPLAAPSLDAALHERGWTVATPSLVLRCELDEAAYFDGGLELCIDERPSPEWLEALARWDAEPAETSLHHRALLDRMALAWFASWRVEGRLAAVMVCSHRGDQSHLYDLVVAPDLRGRGIGRAFLRAVLARLARSGLASATLQVLESNVPARSLYASTKFVQIHGYHYRVSPSCGERASCGC